MKVKILSKTILFLSVSLPIYSAPLTQSDVTGWWAYSQGSLSNKSYISTYLGNTADEYNAGGIIPNPETWDVSISGSEVLGRSLNWGKTPVIVGNTPNNNYMVAVSGNEHLAGIYIMGLQAMNLPHTIRRAARYGNFTIEETTAYLR